MFDDAATPSLPSDQRSSIGSALLTIGRNEIVGGPNTSTLPPQLGCHSSHEFGVVGQSDRILAIPLPGPCDGVRYSLLESYPPYVCPQRHELHEGLHVQIRPNGSHALPVFHIIFDRELLSYPGWYSIVDYGRYFFDYVSVTPPI